MPSDRERLRSQRYGGNALAEEPLERPKEGKVLAEDMQADPLTTGIVDGEFLGVRLTGDETPAAKRYGLAFNRMLMESPSMEEVLGKIDEVIAMGMKTTTGPRFK
jgi:hypothetical protein